MNRKTKCAGLSLLMFAFAVCGNATYVAVRSLWLLLYLCSPTTNRTDAQLQTARPQSILLTSTSEQHIWINAPWLLGSAGTIFLDFLVLGQFAWYSKERRLEQERKRKIFADDEEQDSLLRNDGDEY